MDAETSHIYAMGYQLESSVTLFTLLLHLGFLLFPSSILNIVPQGNFILYMLLWVYVVSGRRWLPA